MCHSSFAFQMVPPHRSPFHISFVYSLTHTVFSNQLPYTLGFDYERYTFRSFLDKNVSFSTNHDRSPTVSYHRVNSGEQRDEGECELVINIVRESWRYIACTNAALLMQLHNGFACQIIRSPPKSSASPCRMCASYYRPLDTHLNPPIVLKAKLIRLPFSDCLDETAARNNTWKTRVRIEKCLYWCAYEMR